MYIIDEKLCTGCGSCLDSCPHEAITIPGITAVIDSTRCRECGICVDYCPTGAIIRQVSAAVLTKLPNQSLRQRDPEPQPLPAAEPRSWPRLVSQVLDLVHDVTVAYVQNRSRMITGTADSAPSDPRRRGRGPGRQHGRKNCGGRGQRRGRRGAGPGR